MSGDLGAEVVVRAAKSSLDKHPHLHLILVGDEDFTPNPWGFLRVFDESAPANPVEAGTFATANALAASPPDDGWYTVHNITLAGGLAYVAWYSDGVRVLDLTDPFAPEAWCGFYGFECPPVKAKPAAGSHSLPFTRTRILCYRSVPGI